MNYDLFGSDYSLASGKGMAHESTISPFWHGALTFMNNSPFAKAEALGLPDSMAVYFADPSSHGIVNKPSQPISAKEPFVSDPAGDGFGDPLYYAPSASYESPTTPQQLQYIDAPYAQHYGMDASTAYQEALANTAYQRKVKDLQAAGLNPVLGINGAGAASFYGSPASSSGGGFGSYGSAKSTAADNATKLQYWLPTLVNGVTNAVFTLGTKNGMTGYAAGTIAQNVVSGLLGAVRNHG